MGVKKKSKRMRCSIETESPITESPKDRKRDRPVKQVESDQQTFDPDPDSDSDSDSANHFCIAPSLLDPVVDSFDSGKRSNNANENNYSEKVGMKNIDTEEQKRKKGAHGMVIVDKAVNGVGRFNHQQEKEEEKEEEEEEEEKEDAISPGSNINRKPFKRVWTMHDELSCIKGLFEYRKKTSKGNAPSSKFEYDEFHNLIKENLHTNFDRTQVKRKLRSVKVKYNAYMEMIIKGTNVHNLGSNQIFFNWLKNAFDAAADEDEKKDKLLSESLDDGEAKKEKKGKLLTKSLDGGEAEKDKCERKKLPTKSLDDSEMEEEDEKKLRTESFDDSEMEEEEKEKKLPTESFDDSEMEEEEKEKKLPTESFDDSEMEEEEKEKKLLTESLDDGEKEKKLHTESLDDGGEKEKEKRSVLTKSVDDGEGEEEGRKKKLKKYSLDDELVVRMVGRAGGGGGICSDMLCNVIDQMVDSNVQKLMNAEMKMAVGRLKPEKIANLEKKIREHNDAQFKLYRQWKELEMEVFEAINNEREEGNASEQ